MSVGSESHTHRSRTSPPSPAGTAPRPAIGSDRGAGGRRRWHHRTMSDQPRAVDPPQAPNDARLDALLPSEMAAKASDVGARKAAAGVLPTFVLAVLAGAFVALGAAFATTVAAGSAGDRPVRVRPARRRARVLARPDPGDRRRRGAVHRQQPAGDGLGLAPDHPGVGRAQLGHRLRREPGRGARDRGPGGRLRAVPVRRRRGRRGRHVHGAHQGVIRAPRRSSRWGSCATASSASPSGSPTRRAPQPTASSRSSRRSRRSWPWASSTRSPTCTSSRSRC